MDQSTSIALDVSVAMDTDIGRKRKQNQDAIGHLIPSDPQVLERLGQIFVLADGVGGASGGDLASQYAVSTIISSYYDQEKGEPADRLVRAIAEANGLIYAEWQGQEQPSVMATTVVAAVIRGRDLVIGSVGDSPAYLMREANVRKLTLDHTVSETQREAGVEVDESDPEGRKLVRALGSLPAVKVDVITGTVRSGDHVVLCSDGLTRYVPPQEIEQTVATLAPLRAVKTLIETANERGGADNISVIVLRLTDAEDITQPGAVRDPMEAWGRPRPLTRRTPPPPSARPASTTPESPARRAARAPAENPLIDLWHLLRGNVVVTGVGLAVLLVIFVVIMLLVANVGQDESGAGQKPTATPVPTDLLTATAALRASLTAQVFAAQTKDALDATQAAQAATAAILTQTPPPPAGPIMAKDDWFRVRPGDPIPAFQEPDVNAAPATELVAGANYLIQEVNGEAWNGPWYLVVDNLGAELRWVNGPSLHERVLRISPNGDALPPDQQPTDLSPSVHTPTPISTQIPATPTAPGTPPTPGTPGTLVPTTTPVITYGVELWERGTEVVVREDLDLCRIPSIEACDAGEAAKDEFGTITDGPVASGEHWWWRVQFEDGRAGWIAQVLLGTP